MSITGVKSRKEIELELHIKEAQQWVISAQESLRDWARRERLPAGLQADLGYKLQRALRELEGKPTRVEPDPDAEHDKRMIAKLEDCDADE